MKTRLIKRLSPLLAVIPLTSVMPLTSCGLNKPWSWLVSTNNNTEINYCLLIGQNDHADSIERTRATRKALGTLDESEETKIRTKDNPNVANPVPGEITVTNTDTQATTKFKVTEIEHMEQKSMAGAAWDPITANDTAGTWIAKHGNKITFFVSNNDSMAEGAYWSSNWIKGLPIFGYDANSTTIQRISNGSITGTVDQNASTQCSAAMMMIRVMLEDRDLYWANGKDPSKANGYGSKEYNPLHIGFYDPTEQTGKKHPKYGYVDNSLITVNSEIEVGTKRQVLSFSTAITKSNCDNYLKPDGSAKEPKDMFDSFTHIEKANPETHYNVCHAYANKSETYLVSTLRPYFNEYADRLGIELEIVEGDGTDEAIVINAIDPKPDEKFDAYLINMAKTTSTNSYVTMLAKKACNKEKPKTGREWSANGWDKFEDRLDTPLIFWNRQPHAEDGTIDSAIMNNKFFKYTYFIGVDASAGGQVQGQMIKKYIDKWYTESLRK